MEPGVLALVTSAVLAGAAPVGWARASSTYKSDTRPTLHQPLLMLDGRENSAWCEGAEGDGVNETVTVGFKGTATVDELRIVTGDARDKATWDLHNRARKLLVHEERFNREIVLADKREMQIYKFDQPIEAAKLVVELTEAYKGTGEDSVTCISDIIFVSGGKLLNGPFMADKVGYDRGRAQFMNTWASGPEGSPEKLLSFFFDGTFHFRYAPHDSDLKGVEYGGQYRAEAGKLWIKHGADFTDAKVKRERIGKEDGSVLTRMILRSDTLPKDLAGTYVDRW